MPFVPSILESISADSPKSLLIAFHGSQTPNSMCTCKVLFFFPKWNVQEQDADLAAETQRYLKKTSKKYLSDGQTECIGEEIKEFY